MEMIAFAWVFINKPQCISSVSSKTHSSVSLKGEMQMLHPVLIG